MPGTDEEWHDHWIEHALRLVDRASACARRTCAPRAREGGALALLEARPYDIEYHFPFGGFVGARGHRQPHRLRPEAARAAQRQARCSYFDEETNEHIVPYVIEPAMGVDRCFLTVLIDAYARKR